MTKECMQTYYNFFSNLWKLFKKYSIQASNPDCPDGFWEAFDDEAVQLCYQCNDAYFAQEIILNMMDEVDRLSKGKPLQTARQVENVKQCA